ncbi:MAG: guanylate kinase [Burkholderiaceae bacterium]
MVSSHQGNLLIVAAPSGAGKSTLVNALLASDSTIKLSISYTTRAPRPGEVDGREYRFVDITAFERMRSGGELIESAEVHGHWYGTSARWIETRIGAGDDVLLEIDWQGAQQIKRRFPDAVGIFILPPSIESLEARLRRRGQDEPVVITRRLLAAGGEIAHAREFDYVIINQDFAEASGHLKSIVQAARLRFALQALRHAELFGQLGIHID